MKRNHEGESKTIRRVWKNENNIKVTIRPQVDVDPELCAIENLWLKKLNRKPATGPPVLEIVDTEIRCKQVCDLLKNDPLFPGVVGTDGEFISGATPWLYWPERHKTFPVSQPECSGPFLRFLQIARADGYVAVFDVRELQGLPKSLLEFLRDESVVKFGFSWRSDHMAIDRLYAPAHPLTPKSLCELGYVNDVQSRWIYLTSEVNEHRVAHLPFKPAGHSLSDFIRAAFNINVDKSFRGSGQFWNRPASNFLKGELRYAALDALLHLDMGLLFCQWKLWTHGPAKHIRLFDDFVSPTDQFGVAPSKTKGITISLMDDERVVNSGLDGEISQKNELPSVNRAVVNCDAARFREDWTTSFGNHVGFWNDYAYVFRNIKRRWYAQRYPAYSKLMMQLLEAKMNNVILDKRPTVKLKRLDAGRQLSSRKGILGNRPTK